MRTKINELWVLMSRIRSRIPASEFLEVIFGYMYHYIDQNGLSITGSHSEYFNMSSEIVKRIPPDLIMDLDDLLLDFEYDEIVQFLYELLFLEIENNESNLNGELLNLIISLLKIEENDCVFDIKPNNGAFLSTVHKFANKNNISNVKLMGTEINFKNIAIANMILELVTEDIPSFSSGPVIYGNVLAEDLDLNYNKGYVFPPLGMRFRGVDSYFDTIFKDIKLTSKNTFEWVYIDRLLKNLQGNKKRAVAIVSGRALFNAADKEYRDAIIKEGYLEGIIELPGGIVKNIGAKLFLLVFSSNNESVKLLDVSEDISDKEKLSNDVLMLYNSLEVDVRSKEELLEENNWVPSTVLIKIKKHSNAVLLSTVADIYVGSQYTRRRFENNLTNNKTNYQILTSGDINDGVINMDNLQYIKNDDVKLDKHKVFENDVIITSKSSKVKIVVIDNAPKTNIIVTGGMIIVRPNTNKLNPIFLKIFLESEYGQNALKSIQKGMTIVTINSKDLASINIPLPNIQYQFKIAQKYNNKLSSLLALKSEISKIENDLKNFYFEEVEGS